MTDLSPAAQAVSDAYETTYTETGLVAAIRELANQVVSKPIRLPRDSYAGGAYDQRIIDHQQLLAIAAELEAR